jgi:hypothetical protein
MADVGLTNAIRELTAVMRSQLGLPASGKIIDPGKSLVDPMGAPMGARGYAEMHQESVEAMKNLTDALGKTAKDQRESIESHARKLETFTAAMVVVGPGIQQWAKYNYQRPYELLGGTPGQVGRGMLEREKDAGQLVTAALAAAAGLATMNPWVAGTVAGIGQLGLNRVIGRNWLQEESLQAGGLQTIAQMTQERIPGFREAAMQQYGLQRFGVAAAGMGAGRGVGVGMAAGLTAMGMTAPESIQLMANAVQAGGALGFRRLIESGGAKAITEIVNQGIYGVDPNAIATSLAVGFRLGFSKEMMQSVARQSGLQLADVAQAAQVARTQLYLGGPAVGAAFVTRAAGTTMAREMGSIIPAMQQASQLASNATGAAERNEAQEMLLFQQFQRANPGASYTDFIEARRNKETDPRWLKTIQAGTSAYAAGGQQGRILGGALFGVRPQFLAGAAQFMTEFMAPGGIGEATTAPGKGGAAGLAPGARQMAESDLQVTLATVTKFQKQYGDQIKDTTDKLKDAAIRGGDFNTMLKDMAETMDQITRSATGLWWENAGRWFENVTP